MRREPHAAALPISGGQGFWSRPSLGRQWIFGGGTLGAHQLGIRQQAPINVGKLHRWSDSFLTPTRWSREGTNFVRLTVRPNSRARSQIKFDRSWVAEVALTWSRPIHARVGTGSACRWCSTAGQRMLQALVACPLKRAAVWVRIPPGAPRCDHGQRPVVYGGAGCAWRSNRGSCRRGSALLSEARLREQHGVSG